MLPGQPATGFLGSYPAPGSAVPVPGCCLSPRPVKGFGGHTQSCSALGVLGGPEQEDSITAPLEGTCLSILAAQPKPHTSSRWDRQGDGKASAASISSTFSNNMGLQSEKDLKRMAQLLDGSSREMNGQGVPAPSVTEETSPSSSNLTLSFTKTKGGDQGCLLRVVPKAVSTQAHRSRGDSLINFSRVVPPEWFAVCALSQSKCSSP